jgi:hypothetical protein
LKARTQLAFLFLVDDFLRDAALAADGSMFTIAPSIAIMSSNAGMATISFDLSATLTCPSGGSAPWDLSSGTSAALI